MKITKEQVIANFEEVKKYIEEAEKEEKVFGISIKNRWTGEIIFQSTKTSYKEAVEERLASDANLRGANLRGADLSCAELNRALFYGRGGTEELKRSQLPSFLAALGFMIVED